MYSHKMTLTNKNSTNRLTKPFTLGKIYVGVNVLFGSFDKLILITQYICNMILLTNFSVISVISLNLKIFKNHDNKKKKLDDSSVTEFQYTLTGQALILQIESALDKKAKKTPEEYYLFNQYEIIAVGETKKFYKKLCAN
ncbi:hypothetical protein BpHYR1_052323 [Brachionus plicatilis]|uniref:Uncharacterized protein n=1 Tax=Brachionus plicatilis TaxID=10195 RepID=A0A3M7T3H0_BRAPC|nr:hypothetical protein BpHYR1_052323 [Brachionus plicatilis]